MEITIADMISKERLLAQSSRLLLEALAEENGMQHLVETGYKMLGNPFSISDMSYKIIALSNNSTVTDDPVWNEVVAMGYSSFSSVNYYATNKFMEMVDQNESPFFWTDPYSKYPRIVAKIKSGQKQLAALIVCAHERPLRETDLELTALLCKAVSIELQKNKFKNYSRGLMHEDFIEDLLAAKIKESQVISERSKALQLNFRQNLYVLTLDISRFDSTKTSLTYMRNEFEQKIANSKAVVYEDRIVMIVSGDEEKLFFQTEIESLKDFLKAGQMFAGISRCFYHLEEVREHYLQSVDALKLGLLIDQAANFFRYDDYAIYHIVDLCSGVESLQKNCHPALLKLIEYDRENAAHYARSLYSYIVNSKNITESSNALNIHRNTIFYRLEKIESIMNVDLNNSNVFLHLHFSFKILEFLKIDLP